jgi:hypothetical protein
MSVLSLAHVAIAPIGHRSSQIPTGAIEESSSTRALISSYIPIVVGHALAPTP